MFCMWIYPRQVLNTQHGNFALQHAKTLSLPMSSFWVNCDFKSQFSSLVAHPLKNHLSLGGRHCERQEIELWARSDSGSVLSETARGNKRHSLKIKRLKQWEVKKQGSRFWEIERNKRASWDMINSQGKSPWRNGLGLASEGPAVMREP